MDVSQKGLGLLLTKTEKDILLANDHLWIRSINHCALESPLFGRIVNSGNRVFKDGQTDIKAGVSLESEIPEDVFRELKDLGQLVLK